MESKIDQYKCVYCGYQETTREKVIKHSIKEHPGKTINISADIEKQTTL